MSQFILDRAFKRASSMVAMATKAAENASPQSAISSAISGRGEIPGLGDSRKLSSIHEQLRHYRDWAYTSIRPIAQKIAGQEVNVGRVAATKPKNAISRIKAAGLPTGFKAYASSLEVLDSHKLLDAINDPNEVLVTWSLLYVTIIHLELTGSAYWWMPEIDGRRQIWPVVPSWIEPVHTGKTLFASWKLRPYGSMGEPKPIPAEDVAYFCYPDAESPLDGYGPLAAQARSVTMDESTQLAQVQSMRNGVHPGMALIVGDQLNPDKADGRAALDPDQRNQLISAIKKHYQGVVKYGEPLILDALIRDVRKITNTPQEMDFMASSQVIESRIQRSFGTNQIVTGAMGTNRAEAAAAGETFATWTVNPKCELLSQIITKKVVPAFSEPGEKLLAWIEPARVHDVDATRADYALGFQYGAVSRNEYRANVLSLPPAEGLDTFLAPGSLIPMGEDGEIAVPTPEEDELPEDDNEDEDGEGDTVVEDDEEGKSAEEALKKNCLPLGWPYEIN